LQLSKENRHDLLAPLVQDEAALRAAYRRRLDQYDYVKIHPADEAKYAGLGWESHKRLKSSLRVKKQKSKDKTLEDRLWCLLYSMGYDVLSGDNFKIAYKRADGSIGEKQVDVFAKDQDTAIVIECKARELLGRRALQKDIHETENLQKGFAHSIRTHFAPDYKPKILWIYATENIIWNEKDVERAGAANIRIVTENELQYFEAFIAHIGTAGKYQFLAEFLDGQDIPNLSNIKVVAARGYFGKHKYYSFTVSARHILKIAFVNHRALNHPDGRPAYQRMIIKKRIKDIGLFIQNGGFFPTNILLNFVENCRFDLLSNKDSADGNVVFGWLYLPKRYKSAWVIDGQHRLYGFSNLPEKLLDTPLFVLAFEKMDNQTEAELFITINHEQKSVSKSLLVALQADLKLGSGDPREALSALASALIRQMGNDSTTPLFRRFSTPGIAPSESQNLTLAEAVKGLVRSGLLGRVIARKSRLPGFLSGQTDSETLKRARYVLSGYFGAIMASNPDRWRRGRAAYVCVNPGIRAHLLLIQEVLLYLQLHNGVDPHTEDPPLLVDRVVGFIEPLRLFLKTAPDSQVESRFSRRFGEGGVVEYFYNLCDILSEKCADFGNDEFKRYKAQQADARIQQADRDITDLQNLVSQTVVERLKKIHGTEELTSGEKAYWELGIENQEIKQNAYRKQLNAPIAQRAPKEAYLDLIDFDKILRQPNNWSHFEKIFSIPLMGEQKNKKYFLSWLEKLNELRRVTAHKSPYRSFTEDDLEFIRWLKRELFDRVSAEGVEVA
jgi:DGQHR domain-containing protein